MKPISAHVVEFTTESGQNNTLLRSTVYADGYVSTVLEDQLGFELTWFDSYMLPEDYGQPRFAVDRNRRQIEIAMGRS